MVLRVLEHWSGDAGAPLDLVPALLELLEDLPADLAYVRAFHFVEVSTSALGYHLSTFEVANDLLLDREGVAWEPAEDDFEDSVL